MSDVLTRLKLARQEYPYQSYQTHELLGAAIDELTAARDEAERLRARADSCQQEAQIWKQEARVQSATVAKIYQELTGKTGEPGDWNGARPLVPAILRKQAEKLDEIAKLVKEADENGVATVASIYEGLVLNSSSLRQQAQSIERGE